jgi:hypothetical protein
MILALGAISLGGIACGALIAVVGGGRLRHLRQRDLNWVAPIVAASLVMLASRLGLPGGTGVLAAGALAVLVAACLANLHLPGAGVVAVGLAANLLPLLLVGATPVDPRALEVVGSSPADLAPTQMIAGESDSLALLASQIPVPLVNAVVSFGDLIVVVGLAALSRSLLLAPVRRGIHVRDVLDDGPLTIDLTTEPVTTRLGEHPVEVGPGQPVAMPLGWERDDDGVLPPALASLRPHRSRAHPTMRLTHH